MIVTCVACLEPDSLQAFEDRLVNMATSESLYLLNTFANMAQSRHAADDAFVTLVTLEIFEVCTRLRLR